MTRLESLLAKHEAPICALLVAIVFAPYWPADVLPYHDSIFRYQFFHFAYSQVLLAGELPLWVPYGNYGLAAAHHQLTTLTPANYLVGAAGILTGAGNTLLLFKISAFLEVAFYAAGLLLLARSLYGHVLARFAVVFGGVCSLSWLFQPYFNFHAFYLYPWLLLFLFAFLRGGDPGKLWLAAAFEFASLIGTAPYFVPLHLFVLVVLCGVTVAAGARPPWVRDLKRWLLCWQAGVAAVLAAVLAAGAWLGVQEVVTAASGRDPGSIQVPLATFLEYGRMTKLTMADGYLLGWVTHADNTYYIGLLPLVLVVSGLLRLRQALFLGVAAAALSLVWLSFGGVFSRLVYFFPAMSLFRHIGLTFGLSGLLLVIASGWVIDDLLRRGDEPSQAGPLRIQRAVVAVIAALMTIDLLISWRPDDFTLIPVHHDPLLYLFPVRLLVYLAAIAAVLARSKGTAGAGGIWAPLVAAYALDIASYQASVYVTMPKSAAAMPAGAFAPDRLPYRPTRGGADSGDPSLYWKLLLLEGRVNQLGTSYANSATYAFTYTFVGVDPCYPRLRSDLWQQGVHDALIARGARLPQRPPADFLPADDAGYRASLGCGASKITLVESYVAAGSEADARKLLRSTPDPRNQPVLEIAQGDAPAGKAPETIGEAEVSGFGANRAEFRVVNGREHPIWMVYADAFHSGWRASVDGAPVPVIRANVGFKAVSIPPGRHAVTLTFGQGVRQFMSGLLAAAGCAIAVAGLIAAIALTARRQA